MKKSRLLGAVRACIISFLFFSVSAHGGDWLGTQYVEMDLNGTEAYPFDIYGTNTSESFHLVQPQVFDSILSVSAGDSFALNLDFTGDQSFKYTDLGGDDNELFGVRMFNLSNSDGSRDSSRYHLTVEFLGVEGDLSENGYITSSGGVIDGSGGSRNLTDTSFSFQGINVLFVIESVNGDETGTDAAELAGMKAFAESDSLDTTETQLFEIVQKNTAVHLSNGGFSNGTDGWAVEGNGTATVVADTDTGEQYVQLSVSDALDVAQPVTLTQLIDTPNEPFEIGFDMLFGTTTGSLEVLLNDTLLDTFLPSTEEIIQTILVEDESFWGLQDAVLQFALYPGSPADVILDNIVIEPTAAVDSDSDGIFDDSDACPATAIPEGVPTVRLGTSRWALVDDDLEFDTTNPKGKGPGRSYSTTDTAGCSCEQIIAALELGKGHEKFGCSISAMDEWVSLPR
jgi:hypothetical protein